MTGKFWRLLAPVSPSPASFFVTPSGELSIPSRWLKKIGLARIALRMPSLNTPVWFHAIALASPGATPPITQSVASSVR
jgi:hypothetical protein